MKVEPIIVQVAERLLQGEPKNGLASSGEDTRRGNGGPVLPPLALESSAFRRTVWAHMDPYKRGRLNLDEFEDRLNVLPVGATHNVSTFKHMLRVLLRCM